MPNEFVAKWARYRRLHAALLVLVWLGACGDDGTADSDSGPDAAVVCTKGRTETGCMCSPEQPAGSRHCGDDERWEACVCPPPGTNLRCSPGQEVLCFMCPGERERRKTACLESGTYVCDCPGERPGDAATSAGDAG
jgi:hypothetical protein